MTTKGEDRRREGEQWGHSEEDMEQLRQSCPCRHDQIASLLALFGESHHATPASIFVYGHTATGKTHVLTSLLSILKLPHVVVRCVECYSARFLMEHILANLPGASSQTGLHGADASGAPRCDNMNDFVRHLCQQLEQRGLDGETLYLVFDKAELLRGMDANILPALLRLQELTKCNICVLLISEIVWEKFRTGTGYAEPYQLLFPDYLQEELLQILMLDSPEGLDPGLYRHYLNILLAVFHLVCRDLRELRHLATLNFPHYIEPIDKGEATADDHKKLWRHIEPHLKKALQTVYLREVSSLQWERMQQQVAEGAGSVASLTSGRTHMELPFYSKYLLIAAYLASYNPAKTDRRFFVKKSGKVNKRLKLAKKHERTSNHLLGPKPFPLDRLMAIFYSLVEGRVAPTANIFSQVTSLVSLQLLATNSASDQIDAPRYKCLVSLDFIKAIARTVGFDIMRYLYDFI